MKKIVVLVFLVATFSIAGYASSACLNSVFLNQMDGGGFTCYIAGGGGFPDVLFSNFAYTPSGGAPPDTLITVSLNSNFTGGYEQAGFAFNPTNGWQVGQGFTLSYTAA